MGGRLNSGEHIVIKPKNNYAFSVIKTRGKSTSRASYNVMLINGEDIIYEDKNLVDDIYLVFHDDVLEGDRMRVEVNRGYFDYKLTPLLSLPKIVKNVLEPEVLERAKKPKKVKKKPKKKTVAKKEPVITAPIVEKKIEKVVAMVETPKVEVPQLHSNLSGEDSARPIEKTFFEKFTKIFKALVKSLSFAPVTSTAVVEAGKYESKELLTPKDKPAKIKDTLPSFSDSALKHAALRQENSFSGSTRGMVSHFDDSNLQRSASLEESAFLTPKRGLSENFDDDALQKSATVSKRVFNAPKVIAVDSQLPAGVEKKFLSPQSREPKLYQESFSKQTEQVPTFKPFEPLATEALPKLQRELASESVPRFSNTIQKPARRAEPKQKILRQEEREIQTAVNTYDAVPKSVPLSNDRTAAYPDTGYKEGYKELEQSVSRVKEKPVRQRVVEDTSLPEHASTRSDEAGEKLVITKIIDKKEPEADPFAGRVLGRMDDRVLGNGYNGAASSAKLGMRVTKNSRAVSAWVEVFKNGTKQRVKTFYTSKGRKAKSVNLPAGNYMVRATYRTRDTKQQKMIKNIRLVAGENVNKSIAFHDGKLRIVARRGNNPLYVKVVAYKSGSRQRVAYDFSSRTSGVVLLSLSSGTYDIEVLDHKKNRIFDSIRIRAGKTNTINADF